MKMHSKFIQTLISCTIVYGLTLEDQFFVEGLESQEMIEKGRAQYQLLQERGSLPQYGTCWKDAIAHVNEGCKHLSEDTQSDMALHLTNCFLEMSGHETYKCELDKKPNLRGICINNMSDRAFSVYTEFYTHAQNMCWFLRGQVWHETIAENTVLVGKQLKLTAANQEKMLFNQNKALLLQERMLNYTNDLEKVLEKFYVSTKHHQEIISVMSESLGSLQTWLVGEVSWFDSIIFYTFAIFVAMMVTSIKQTFSARFPLLILLMCNLCVERFLCKMYATPSPHIKIDETYKNYYKYVWWCRNFFTFTSAIILVLSIYFYKDYLKENHNILAKIYEQNSAIYRYIVNKMDIDIRKDDNISNGTFSYIKETPKNSFSSQFKTNKSVERNEETSYITNNLKNNLRNELHSTPNVHSTSNLNTESDFEDSYKKLDESSGLRNSSRSRINNLSARKLLNEYSYSSKYNLRSSRQNTPDLNV